MKRKFLVGLLCLTVLLVPSLSNAAGTYIAKSDFTQAEQETLKATNGNLLKEVGNVKMLKSNASKENGDTIYTYLTISEKGGFTENTYKSILAALEVILTEQNYKYFTQKYPALSNQDDVLFTGFRIYRNIKPEDYNEAEKRTFHDMDSSDPDAVVDIIRVEICFDEFVKTPDPTPTPTPTPTPDVVNPSTGDANILAIGAVVTVAVLGAYFSVRKIREN